MMGKITLYANNAEFVQEDGSKVKLNQIERRQFSKIMMENVIAAYNQSMIGEVLKAPFQTNDVSEWQAQLDFLRHINVKY